MNEIVINRDGNGKTFRAKPGDLVSIRLPESPTTGYLWVPEALDERIVKVRSSGFAMAPASGVGGGGVRTFTLQVLSAGIATAGFRHMRSWEPKDKAIDRFSVTIDVQ